MYHRKLSFGLAVAALSLAWLAFVATPAAACPNCATTVGEASKDRADGGDPASAFNYSIYLMIGTMVVVGLGMGRLMYVVVKQADAEHAAVTLAANSAPAPTISNQPATPGSAQASTPPAALASTAAPQ